MQFTAVWKMTARSRKAERRSLFFVGETITPAVKEGDLFVAVSGSGKSTNVVNDAKRAAEKGASVIAVTSKKDSPLADVAGKVLIIPGTVRGDAGESRGSIQLLSSLFDQSLHITLDSMIDGRMNNMPSKMPAHQRRPRKRRKGKLPLKGRESVLRRLKEYQEDLAAQRGQIVVSQDSPDLQERRKA